MKNRLALTACLWITALSLPRGAAPAADPDSLDARAILKVVSESQEMLVNHHVKFEMTCETEGKVDLGTYSFDRILYGKKMRMGGSGTWSGGGIKDLRFVITPELGQSCNTVGSEENYLGSIRAARPSGYIDNINRDMCGPWLFGLANGDPDYAWRLMAAHPEKVTATESLVEGVRRIRLSASLPSGRYELEVEPDFGRRIRRFSFEKLHSEGHFPPVSEEDKQSLPEGKDHFAEFIRGAFEAERYSSVGELWVPVEGRFDYQFHYTHMEKPGRQLWRARVTLFERLDSPPAAETFEMKWPPHAQVTDTRTATGESAPRYYADEKGELHPMRKLAVGDALPPLTGRQWYDPNNAVDLGHLKGKYVFLYNWATWCGPCMAELPEYQRVSEHFRNDPQVVFFGINAYDKGAPLERCLSEKGISFPQLIGEDARIAKNVLGFMGAGSGLVVGPDGKVIETDLSPQRLEAILSDRTKAPGAFPKN